MNVPHQLIGVIGLAYALVSVIAQGGELATSTPAAAGLSQEKLEDVHEIMNGLVRDRHIAGGIVLIARHGKVVFHEPYGLMHLEKQLPVERGTIFRFYSMSKAITSAAALVLVDEGKLDLNAPVSRYLPEFTNLKVLDGEVERPAHRAMTVIDLFRHTSGITYGDTSGSGVEKLFGNLNVLDKQSDLALMATKLGQMPLCCDPGQDWQYGASIDVLGHVVEIVSGQPLDVFLQERIFAPLGMTDTGFYVPPAKQPRFAANYHFDGQSRLIIRDESTKS
jgi:CubicO group peptidase (beta-lactamase class C family)